MTTTVTAPPIETLAAPAALDRHVERMTSDQPTLTDISAVLHLIGTADEIDGVRIQALCFLASRALGKFDAFTRTAPADELAAVVRDAQQDCANAHQGCQNVVLPWVYNGRHCSPSCASDDERTRL